MLAQHLHDATIRGKLASVGVLLQMPGQPALLRDFVERGELVGCGLVRSEDAKAVHVQPHDVPEQKAERLHVVSRRHAGLGDGDGMGAEVRHVERLAKEATIRDGVRAHPPMLLGDERLELRDEPPRVVE